jgi:hypothetical protein
MLGLYILEIPSSCLFHYTFTKLFHIPSRITDALNLKEFIISWFHVAKKTNIFSILTH